DPIDKTSEARQRLALSHDGSPYYADAERWLGVFWGDGSVFRLWFEDLDLTDTLELACGHGRHSAQIIESVGSLTLVDILESNIDACRARFDGNDNGKF